MDENNKRKIELTEQEIKKEQENRAQLRRLMSESEKRLKSLYSRLAWQLGKPVSEISAARTIGEILLEILKEAKRPLHAKELVAALRHGYPGYENTAHQTVTGVLIRHVNKGKHFQRVAPNVYDVLKEDQDNSGQ